MKDEFSDRHQAIKLLLAGQSVEVICQTLDRSREWFHTWWRRYQAMGAVGLYDLTRARQRTTLISPEMERAILTIRKRLESTYHPQMRYALIGASAIQAELKALHIRSVPCARTIERVLQRNGMTLPSVRLAHFLSTHVYPTPQAQDSNQLHQVDLVGPIYLKGQKQRYYIFVCKDVFDGAVCLKLGRSRKIEAVLDFLGDCWKTLGRPKQVQLDNAREYLGWGTAARYLSRLIRLCLRFEVEPIFIPPARPQYNGSVENFNGWFQPRLFQRYFTRVSALKRELQRLQDTVNTQHVQRRLGGLTPEQYRRRKKLQKLPPRFVVPTEPLPIAAGRLTFIRQVTRQGNLHLLSQAFFWSYPVSVESGRLGKRSQKMPKSHSPYPEECRQQILELVRAGRSPEELAEEFEPTAQTIRNWIKQSELDHGQRQDGLTSDEKAELSRIAWGSKKPIPLPPSSLHENQVSDVPNTK